MIGDLALGPGTAEDQALEKGGGRLSIEEPRIALEAETAVIGRIAEHDAAGGADGRQAPKTIEDEGPSDAVALARRRHRGRPKAIPVAGPAVDPDRREGDVADDLARLLDDMTTREVPWERLDTVVPDAAVFA